MTCRCIVHFQPLEKYPPAINFLRVVAGKQTKNGIHVLTSKAYGRKDNIEIPGIIIHRIAYWKPNLSRLARMIFYLRFIIVALYKLIRLKPSSILYYETLSAGAPYFYKKYLNSKANLFIHYHEYTSPEEYATGMVLNRWLHGMERKLYRDAFWISHTNEDRMKFFLKDTASTSGLKTKILPNHPPSIWSNNLAKTDTSLTAKIGIVYVGAFSLETLYVKEFSEWVIANKDGCYWDIYTDNFDLNAKEYIEGLNTSNIQFKGGVEYDNLPGILKKYQVGVILYKGHIPNYVYNIPNKFFEYYVCGLDVWFPNHLLSSLKLVTSLTYPQVHALDFQNLNSIQLEELSNRKGKTFIKDDFSSETTYEELANEFLHL